MKSSIVFLLLFAAIGFAFAGGGSETTRTTGTAGALSRPGTYPIVQEKTTIDVVTVFSQVENTGENLRTAMFTSYLEDLTNVHVNWVEIIEATVARERINLLLASGNFPEVIMNTGLGAQQIFLNGVSDAFKPINDLINARMPNLAQTFADHDWLRAQMVMPDGNIYAFPNVESGCYHCRFPTKMWVYQPWLDRLGLSMPQTTEEFYQVLRAFKTSDPNGNGMADEIPLIGAVGGNQPINFIMNAFAYSDQGNFTALTNGSFLERSGNTVRFVADTAQWREGLRYLYRLVSEGLLAPESFVQQGAQLRAAVENPGPELVGMAPGLWWGTFSVNGGGTGRFAGFKPVPPLQGPSGVRQASYLPVTATYHTVITNRARNPELIAQWMDWFYVQGDESAERFMLSYNGWQEGIDWRWLTPAEEAQNLVARDGSPGRFITLNTSFVYGTDKYDEGWRRTAPRNEIFSTEAMPREWADDPSRQMYHLMTITRDDYEPHYVQKYLPPNVVFDDAVQDEFSDTRDAVLAIVNQFSTEFITGVRDINNDSAWNTYVTTLRNAGVERYVTLWNETLLAAGY